jgi:hypothetical protein
MPTQFTGGKTKATLQKITKRYLLNESCQDKGEHSIEIIVTNNSLQETEQWKYRTQSTFKNETNINIDILSSKSKDYKSIDEYISKINLCENVEDLPNILIVCYHKKRVCDDLIKLFKIFAGIHRNPLPGIAEPTKIVFNVSLDEADANIGVTKKFLKNTKKFIERNAINHITFITATAIPRLWDALQKCGIHKLLNMNYFSTSDFTQDYEDYRAFKDHEFKENSNDTQNSLNYIMGVFPSIQARDNLRKIIFAPAHLFTNTNGVGSHEEVMNFFKSHNYTVLIMNGKKKAFVYPNGTEIDIVDFNQVNNIDGELRNTLRVWYEKNPISNLAITGNTVIERGVTFNTDGFNFTDMILSNYHKLSVGKLVQISGRATGGKKFVNKMFVHCTKSIKDLIDNENERLIKICKLKPESFNRTDFTDSKNAVPVKVVFKDENIHRELVEKRENGNSNYKGDFDELFKRGVRDKKIELIDKNNLNKLNIKLDSNESRIIKNIKMYTSNDGSPGSRRFKQFSDAHETYKTPSQTSNEKEYNLDFCKDRYVHDGFINETNVGWITFKVNNITDAN